MSAGERSSFSAIVCGVAPWTTCSEGPAGRDRLGSPLRRRLAGGLRRRSGGAGAGGLRRPATATAGAAAAFAGFGLARRGCGGGSRTSRGFAAAVAWPPDARRRGTMSSGTLEEADLPAAPICSRAPQATLAGHAELFGQFVDPHALPSSPRSAFLAYPAPSYTDARPQRPSDRPCRARVGRSRRRGARTRRGRRPTRGSSRPTRRAPDEPHQLVVAPAAGIRRTSASGVRPPRASAPAGASGRRRRL